MSGDDYENALGRNKPSSFAARVAKPDAVPEVLPPEALPSDSTEGKYKPYGLIPSSSITETCDVQRWLDDTEIAEGTEFQYRFLLRVAYIGEEQLRLFLPDCLIVIDGKNLRDLRKKLARRQATFVQQFSRKVWKQLPEPGEPIVTNIAILRPDEPTLIGKS